MSKKIISNFDIVNETVKKYSNKKQLQSVIIPMELFEYTGETQKAVFLSRLIYLSDKGSKANGFIWKSYSEWKSEIGLSKAQVERIVKDFQDDRGILIAKKMLAQSKNNNASNTFHYKLLMDNFLADFKKFLVDRRERKSKLEQQETLTSITKNTDINTPDISLSEKINNSEEIKQTKEVNEKESDDTLTSNFDNYENGSNEITSAEVFTVDEVVSLPRDFEPTLASKVWAIKTFHRKYLKPITAKFISYYSQKENIKKSLEEWQDKWREWVEKQIQRNINFDIVDAEHEEIENEFFNLVLETINQINFNIKGKERELFIVPNTVVILQLCESDNFEEDHILEALDILTQRGFIVEYFGYYYDSKEYEEDKNYANEVDLQIRWVSENYIQNCNEISEYIRERLLVKPEEIIRKFHWSNPKSIQKYLEVRQMFEELKEIGGYLCEFDGGMPTAFNDWTPFRDELDRRGIKYPEGYLDEELEIERREKLEAEAYEAEKEMDELYINFKI